MKKQVVMKFAATGVLMSVAVIGCTPAAEMRRPVSASAAKGRVTTEAGKFNHQAQEALARGEVQQAIGFSEQAVASAPRDVGYRLMLAELYLKAGRFTSAEATFAEALQLYPGNKRASLNLALTQIALGKTAAAVATLEGIEAGASPSDVGLAYALAGETQRAVELLETAARDIRADGRVRQNLALAHALAGDWQKSRLIAAQDVQPAELEQRLQQWATFTKPSAQWDQVATLLGVTPAEDPGRPVHIALAGPQDPAAAFAAAEPAPSAEAPVEVAAVEAEPAAPIQVAAVEAEAPLPVTPDVDRFVASIDAPPPVRQAELPSEEQVQYAAAAESLVTPAVMTSVPRVERRTIPTFEAPAPHSRRQGFGRFVVQLGAYRTAAGVEMGWAQLYRRYGLSRYSDPLSTTITLAGRGTFHRLAIAGFDSHAAASSVCNSIKGQGGACFVRSVAGDRPVQWAARYRNNLG